MDWDNFLAAVRRGDTKTVSLLINKVDPTSYYNTALATAFNNRDFLMIDVLIGNEDIRRVFISCEYVDKACHNRDIEMLRKMIDIPEFDRSCFNDYLLRKVYDDDAESVAFAINDVGVNPSYNNNEALILAIEEGNNNIVRILLEDPRINAGIDDNRALILTLSYIDQYPETKEDYVAILTYLLFDDNVDPSVDNDRALLYAAKYGSMQLLDRLLRDKRVNISAQKGQVLVEATDNEDMVRLLLSLPNTHFDFQGAVERAVAGGKLGVVKLLVGDRRVNPNTVYSDNTNVLLESAVERGYKDVFAFLVDKVDPATITPRLRDVALSIGDLGIVDVYDKKKGPFVPTSIVRRERPLPPPIAKSLYSPPSSPPSPSLPGVPVSNMLPSLSSIPPGGPPFKFSYY